MIKYKCKIQNRHGYVDLDFLEPNQLKNCYLIENSLGRDIEPTYQTIRREVEEYLKVVFGDSNEYGGGGNINVISANKDYTIFFEGYDGDNDEVEVICKIETIEFVKLILVWGEAVFRYNYSMKLMTKNEFQDCLIWIDTQWNSINIFENINNQEKK